ncbi:hypothetical protein [Nocardia sp. NPDC057030]|uniref:hypothetical protein n=1 Tax=unclassified Nocardia TaxID=2637762 RepID=UPI00362B59E5
MKALFVGGPMHMCALEFREPVDIRPVNVNGIRYLHGILTLTHADGVQRQHVVFHTPEAVTISDYPEVLEHFWDNTEKDCPP